jgi:hypothetical protein
MSQSETASRFRSKLFSAAKIFALILVVLLVGGYFIQQQLVPDVDPSKTRPVVVSNSGNVGEATVNDESVDLPEGAITANINQKMINAADHPFQPLLKVAEQSIVEIDKTIRDYEATFVSQVFLNGKLQPEKYLRCKIRHRHMANGKEVPFSVYTLFLAPQDNVGQEAIWIEGQNDGNIIAHANGLLNVKRFYLDPDGPIAMDGNRYPIRDIGVRGLIVKMQELGQKDIKHGECQVSIKRKVDVNGCECTMLQAVHPVKRDHFDFHIARIFIDDARNIPIAYEGYSWPEKEGDEPPLLEKYYYTDIELNVGLTDEDFDPGNKKYNYPSW